MLTYQNHQPEHGARGTLVCLPGVNSGAYLMQGVLPVMGASWHIVLFNPPGVDGSSLPLPFSAKAYAREALNTLNALGITDFILLGHSLGGYAAQELARMVPNRVQKLVLVSTSRGQPDTAMDVARMQQKMGMSFWEFQKLVAKNDAKGHEPLFGPQFAMREKPTFEAFLHLRRQHLPAQSVSLAHVSAGGLFSSFTWARKLKMPALVIHGGADILVGPESGRKLADVMPHAQWLELYDVGHFPMLEYVGFWDKIRQFAEGVNLGEVADKDEPWLKRLWQGLWFHG